MFINDLLYYYIDQSFNVFVDDTSNSSSSIIKVSKCVIFHPDRTCYELPCEIWLDGYVLRLVILSNFLWSMWTVI